MPKNLIFFFNRELKKNKHYCIIKNDIIESRFIYWG